MYFKDKKKFVFYETMYFPTDRKYQEEMLQLSAKEAAQEVADKGIMSYEEAFPIALRDARAAAEEQKQLKERAAMESAFIGRLSEEGGCRWTKYAEDKMYFGRETYYDLKTWSVVGASKKAQELREKFELE